MPLPSAMLDAIDGIYGAAISPELWPSVLRRIDDLLGSTLVSINVETTHSGYSIESNEVPAGVASRYAQHYRSVDPVRLHVEQSPGGIYSSRQIVPKPELRRREIYGDFCRQHGFAYCMQGYLFRENGGSALIAACRPAEMDEFEPAEVEILERLAPHIKRALKVQLAATAAEKQTKTLAAALDQWPTAVFAIEANGHIALTNGAVDILLGEADGFCVRDGVLRANTNEQTRLFHNLLKRALGLDNVASGGGSMLLERAPGRRPLSVQVLPCTAASAAWLGTTSRALAFVSDPERADKAGARRLQGLYRLTLAEAALAELIGTGIGVKAAARSLGIAPSTARSQLRRTLDKPVQLGKRS